MFGDLPLRQIGKRSGTTLPIGQVDRRAASELKAAWQTSDPPAHADAQKPPGNRGSISRCPRLFDKLQHLAERHGRQPAECRLLRQLRFRCRRRRQAAQDSASSAEALPAPGVPS